MRILYLAHRIPYPPNKGDKIRSFNEIKYLSLNNEIFLVCLADDPVDLQYEEELKKYCKTVHTVLIKPGLVKLKCLLYLSSGRPLTIPYFYSTKIQNIVNSILSSAEIDVVLCFSSPMAEYIFRNKNYNHISKGRLSDAAGKNIRNQTTFVMDFVDVDSDKWRQYSAYTKFPYSWLYRMESVRLARYERQIAATFDQSIFVSDNEAELFKNQNPMIANVKVIANGVDIDYFNPDRENKLASKAGKKKVCNRNSNSYGRPLLLFTGAMDYYANVDGVVWFSNDVFPEVKRKFPNAQFYIVGSRPHRKVWDLMKKEGIVVTGFVEDIRQYYRMADVSIIPLRIARGIQNKILEAMAFALPVVATPQAIAGINAVPGKDIEIAGNTEEFVAKTIHVLDNERLRDSLGENGRNVVKKHYDWSTNVGNLESILRSMHQSLPGT